MNSNITVERLQAEASAFARASKFTPASNLYVPGTRRGTTPEQAYAASLEANPESYAEYRERHNAKALVSQLERAGFRLR